MDDLLCIYLTDTTPRPY